MKDLHIKRQQQCPLKHLAKFGQGRQEGEVGNELGFAASVGLHNGQL